MAYVKKEKKRKFKSWTGKLFSDQLEYINAEAERTGVPAALLVRQAVDLTYGLPKETEVK